MTEPETPSEYVARCVRCDRSFTEAEIEGASACPGCGSRGIPMDPKKDVSIRINVHELRILGIWAENHAVHSDNQHLDDAYHESMKETVGAITARIETQLRTMGLNTVLTMSGEIAELKRTYPSVQVYRDGKEEV